MDYFYKVVECLFMCGALLNSVLFIPQILNIYSSKSSSGISLLMFSGFLFIQVITVMHGYVVEDKLLMYGYSLSVITCGCVIFFGVKYRVTNSQ